MIKKPLVITIVGDPGSGKSVLTNLVYRELAARGYRLIRQEAELFSPTPPWYMEAIDRERIEELRKLYKTKEEEIVKKRLEWVKNSLEALSRNPNLDFVVVDIGGGTPQERVTKENREILQYVDYVIVLCRSDNFKECAQRWINEIKSKTPNVKIAALCESKLEDKTDVNLELGRCVITELRREKVTSPELHTVEGVKKLVDHLEKLRYY